MQEPLPPGSPVATGQFTIVSVLGRGSQGITYEAERASDGRRVALKELAFAELRDWKAFELFEREGRVLELLDHPAIPRFLGIFRDETAGQVRCYIARALVPGQTLAARVAGGRRWAEPALVELARGLLAVVIYLQGRTPPVYHRDIKPHNVVLDEADAPHLIDFGAARDLHGTVAGGGSTVAGTLGYMAPEQLGGQAAPSTDLYGLAATLLFAFTGEEPSAWPRRKLAVDLSGFAGLSAGMRHWLERCLAPAPEDRFAGPVEALGALGAPAPRRGISRRRLALRAGLLAVFGVLFWRVGRSVGLLSAPRPWLARPTPEIIGQSAPTMSMQAHWQAVTAIAFVSDRQSLLTGSHDTTVRRWSLATGEQTGDFSQPAGAIRAIAAGAAPERFLVAGKGRLRGRDGAASTALPAPTSEIAALAADPALRRGLIGQRDGQVQLWDLEQGRLLRSWSVPGGAFAVARSETQRLLFGAGDRGTVHVWSEPTGEELLTLAHGDTINALALTPDGLTLASAGDDARVAVWHVSSGQRLRTLEGHRDEVWSLALAPDGDTLASGGRDGQVLVWSIRRGALVRVVPADGEVTALTFSPDGAWLAVGTVKGQVHLFRLSGAASELPIRPPPPAARAERDADVEGRAGWSPLHSAAHAGDLAAVRAQLDGGAPVDARNQLRRTPLYNAAKSGHAAVAALLLERGADPNAGDVQNKTPLYVALQSDSSEVVDLLLGKGASPAATTTFGRTLLHHAAQHARVELVARLLPTSDVNARQADGVTPLMEASERGALPVVEALLARPGVQLDRQRYDGATALRLASAGGHAEVARLLVQKGANPNLVDKHGATARTAAERANHVPVVALLAEAGAR